jgi:carbonic anhydrase
VVTLLKRDPVMLNPSLRFTREIRQSAMLAGMLLAFCHSVGAQSHGVDPGEPDAAGETHTEIHWGYEDENGPAAWASMKPEWQLCARGRQQSPIDLASAIERPLPAIGVHNLSEHAVEVLNQNEVLEELDNGHTVQVNVLLQDALQIDNKAYALQQFHFHSPSEHTLDGKHWPMEIHFVHKAGDGSLAVLGVLVNRGAENAAIESLWASLPQTRGETTRTQLPASFARSLLTDAERGFFHYRGSLTTPPCTEGVKWMIKKVPTELSGAQIQRFQAIYDHNNRPTNPLNERELYVDSSPSFQFFEEADD